MSGPPGIDPALIAACTRRVREAEERLEVSRMRNRHLNRLLDEARSANHLLTRGEVRQMARDAHEIVVWIVILALGYIVHTALVGDYGGALFVTAAFTALAVRAVRIWRRAATIKRHTEETQ